MQDSQPRFTAASMLRTESDGGLRILTLDRPPLNVLNIDMLAELEEAVGRVASDGDAAALMITGEGKAFCAGVDVADHTPERVEAMIERLHGALTAILALEVPVVAAVNGAALGGGLELALACDVVFAREGAKLGQPEIRLGVFPPFAAAILPRLVGTATALDICLSGRTLRAEEGMRLGLVQHTAPKSDFASSAKEYAKELASLSPPVLRLTKQAIRAGLDVPLGEALEEAERLYLDDLMQLEDAREGLAAFLEKRAPVWKGA